LSEAARTLLTLGAVIGPEFSVDILRKVGELPAADAVAAVEEAVVAGLLLPVAGVTGRYRFSHDLVRETLYDDLPTSRRLRLHQQIAQTLEATYAGSSEAHLAELAFHFVHAAQLGAVHDPAASGTEDTRKAFDFARRAGEQAARSLAYEEAARLYRMALGVVRSQAVIGDVERADVLMALGDADARTGDLDTARISFLEAAELARRTGSGQLLGRAGLGYGGRILGGRAGSDTLLIPLLEEALALLGSSDERLRVRLLARLSCALRGSAERRADSDALSQEALDMARALGEPTTLMIALIGRFWATWWPENPAERERLADELATVAQEVGDGERIAEAQLLRSFVLMDAGRLADAVRQLETVGHVIEELRQPAQSWLVRIPRAEIALAQGDYAQAEELDTKGRSSHRVTLAGDDVSALSMNSFLLRREQGRCAEIEAKVRASAREFPWYPVHKAALCLVLLDLGKKREARAIFRELAANEFAAVYRDNEWLLGMSLASEACAVLDDMSAAATMYEQLLPFAGRHAVGHGEGSAGVVDRYLGLLAATVGRLDDAERHLSSAVALLDAMDARPWKAHAQHDLAEVLTRRGHAEDVARAAHLDREALDAAREMGMALAGKIEATGRVGDPELVVSLETKSGRAGRPLTHERGVFRREGDHWAVEFGDASFRVRDSKGMHHLARLLHAPSHEVHSLELARADSTSSAGSVSATHEGLALANGSDAGAILDGQAKAAYKERLLEIRAELAEATDWNDPERVARLEAEQRALVRELASAIGLGGRDRTAASVAERARISVTRAIRSAMQHIDECCPELGAHLAATIRTGTFCSYTPDPRAPISWQL
jgi:tetratricopeptide (TPR) repeat protein